MSDSPQIPESFYEALLEVKNKEIKMLEKLIELNMRDLWDIADQRDWYYEEYQKLKNKNNINQNKNATK